MLVVAVVVDIIMQDQLQVRVDLVEVLVDLQEELMLLLVFSSLVVEEDLQYQEILLVKTDKT